MNTILNFYHFHQKCCNEDDVSCLSSLSPAANLFDADGFPLRAELEPLGPVLGPEDGAVLQLAEALLLQHGQDEHAALQVLAQQVLVHLAQEIFVVPETSWYTYLHVVNKCFK